MDVNNQQQQPQPSGGKVREISDLKYNTNSQEEKPSSVPFPLSDFSQPLHVETDRQVYNVNSVSPRKSPGQPLSKSEPPTTNGTGQYGSYTREHSPPEKLESNTTPALSSAYEKRVIDNIGMSKSRSENWMDVYRDSGKPNGNHNHHQRYSSDSGSALSGSKSAPAIAKKPLLLRKEPLYGGPPGNYENVYRGDTSDVQLRNRKNLAAPPHDAGEEVRRYSYAPEASFVATARVEAMRGAGRRPQSGHEDTAVR